MMNDESAFNRQAKGVPKAASSFAALGMAAALVLSLSVFSGTPALAEDKPFAGVTLRVGTWGGSWRDARHELIGKKLEEQGATIEYVIGTPHDNFAKLLAGRGQGSIPIDVMEISPELTLTLKRMNFLEELDYEKLPNAVNLDPIYKTDSAIATQLIQIGIAYNTEKYEELGLEAPTTFADLFKPELQGRVAMTDVNAIEAPYNLVALALLGGGSEGDLDPGFEKIRELDSAYYYKSSTDLATKFTLGEIWAAPWHAGWVMRVARDGFPLAHVDPQVGDHKGMIAEEFMGILADTKAREAAEFWINEALDPEVQIEFARKVGVVPTNKEALSLLKDDPLMKDFMWRPEDQANAFHMDWKIVEPQMPSIIDRWNRIMVQ